ncbi:MAG: thioredoxin family protein [Rhodocyclaceae bacterium]|nr:thioredoxin family protein [Rhodocyclaceae bacterium]
MKVLFFACALVLLAPVGAALAQTRDADSHFFQISFQDLPEDLALAKAEGKVGLAIMFDAEDCPPCKRMKRDILSQAQVQDYYRKHFRVIGIDFNGDREVVDPTGRKMIEKRYAGKGGVGILGTPSFLFLDLQGREMARNYGEIRSVDTFIKLGEFVVGGAWRSGDFRSYLSQSASSGQTR